MFQFYYVGILCGKKTATDFSSQVHSCYNKEKKITENNLSQGPSASKKKVFQKLIIRTKWEQTSSSCYNTSHFVDKQSKNNRAPLSL